ncbi:protein dopey 1 [Echinococcus multilocularis]|uniref:Protein dopey 1 n=1 Tax=Echinococcus multilocularis TaxID=6211 RepID=A0A087VX01_ECHMU|nr:protein dopey 1 [Echinococcus multilocularis]
MNRRSGLESDPKYRSYSVAIDKCLKSFEYSNEWADLISSLVRLIKLIQQYDRYDVIPKKRLLGKRLAQCLHPALPPGVHCKTLECFDLIFRIMGPNHLAADISIYGPCLFGLLGPSAMTVKPLLFSLFETYFLPLGEKLRTAFLGLLQGLLPGLEEGSEFFERGNSIIEKFCSVVGPDFFYTCLWQVLIHAPSVRHFGTAFILNHFNKRRHLSTQACFFGTSTAVLLESIRCLLADNVVLVQRDTLDFVILTLPVHLVGSTSSQKQQKRRDQCSHPLEGRIAASEMRNLVAAALTVLLRKDASLNRRLFMWLLGSQAIESADASRHATTVARIALHSSNVQNDSDSAIQLQYFKTFSLRLLTEAMQGILKSTLASPSIVDAQTANRSACFRPFRLMGGLLNRSEIGSLLVEHVLVDFVFFTLHMCHRLQRISGNDGGSKSPHSSAYSSESSSPANQRSRDQKLPQQTLEMLAQYDACTMDSILRNSGGSSRNGGRRTLSTTNPRLSFRHSSDPFKEALPSASTAARISAEAEFMREAELFFANLESEFMWPFLQNQFFLSPKKVRRGWVSAVRFLVEHLPTDTYPEVRGCHLPRMVSGLTVTLRERMDHLTLSEIAEFIDLLVVLIAHIQEHMAAMLDQSLADFSRPSTTSASSVSKPWNKEVVLIAIAIGDVRRLLAAFFKHFLCSSSSKMVDNCLDFLRYPGKDLNDLDSKFCEFFNSKAGEVERTVVVDLLAQLCRLVVEMCNVPLVQPSTDSASTDELNFSRLFDSSCGADDAAALPEWLACLVAGGVLSADFDTKAVCLHALLDLVEASTSIHGWPFGTSDCNHHHHLHQQQPLGRSGLLLPVLTPQVLSTLASSLDFFPVAGVSLWCFLNESTYTDDAASLLIRVLNMAPNNVTYSAEVMVENFIVQQMLSADPALRTLAHRRFALLWQFQRSSVSSEVASMTTSTLANATGAGGISNGLGTCVSGWRRAAMGLPPISNESASSVANFNRCILILLDNLDDAETASSGGSGSGRWMHFRDSLFLAPSAALATSEAAESQKARAEVRQVAAAWLTSALSSGQVGRVVAPLFSILLHPSTARTSLLSIRHRRRLLRRIQRRRNRRLLRAGALPSSTQENSDVDATDKIEEESEDDDEGYDGSECDTDDDDGDDDEYDRNIYAPSGGSPSGEFHFYFSSSISQPSTSEEGHKQQEMRPKKTTKTMKADNGDVFDEEYCPVNVMTPLQSANHDTETGISEVERVSVDRARRDVIQARIRCNALLSQLLAPQSQPGEMTTDSANLSPFDQLVASPVKVLPVHEHLLVYLHRYDFNQVTYALSRLCAILRSDVGTLFVLALAASPTASKGPSNSASATREVPRFSTCEFPTLFGTNLADLLARHYRCLLTGGCNDFARHSTMDEIGCIVNYRMPSLLDVLLFICLTFLLSLSLPSESSDNANLRLVAAELLQLITEKLLHLTVILTPTEEGELVLDTKKDESGMTALIATLRDSGSSWIDAVIQRSGLSQAVLHCLATSTELTHISDSLNTADDVSLPLCLRLLKYNSGTENLAELSCLLKLTHHLLQLTAPRGEPSQKSTATISTPSNSRSNKTPPANTKIASKRLANQSSSTSTQVHFSGTLPWCTSHIPVPSSTLKGLTPLSQSTALLSVLTTHFIGSCPSTSHSRSRHVATQMLLLNTLRLGLSPTARVDLHPLWFNFLRESLIYWGAATALLINLMVSQMSTILQMLAEPFCHLLIPMEANKRTPLPSDYPADYTLHLLTCLRGITHTFLLPIGQSKFNLLHGMTLGATAFAHNWSPPATKSSPTHRGKSSSNSSSSFKGLPPSFSDYEAPEMLRDSIRVAEALRDFHAHYNQNFDFAPLGPALQRMQQALLESDASSSALQIALLFTSKDLLGTEVMPDSGNLALNWARGRAEMCHIFPTILASLATIWLALNQACDPSSFLSSPSSGDDLEAYFETGIDALDIDSARSVAIPVRLRCGFNRLPALTALGHPEVVRRAIDNLLEPIALSHPTLFFAALAHVWPPPGAVSSSSLGGGSNDLMWLLSSSPSGLPLTLRQCALVSLISGARWGYQECENKSGRYVSLSSDPSNPERPVALLKASQAVKTLRNLLRSPPASLALAFTLDLSHGEAAVSSPVEETLPPQIMQSSLLHFLFAWIVTTGGIGFGSFQSASVQDFLRDVVPLTSISAAISTTSGLGTAITSPISVFVLVRIFNEVIITLANKDEKRDQKDLQDICQRLMEATASIAGTALEQATWFRRGLQVRTVAATAMPTASAVDISGGLRPPDFIHPVASDSALAEVKVSGNTPPSALHGSQELRSSDHRDSASMYASLKEDLPVLALKMLAEHMAVFFDVVYKSEEKDRVPSALNNGILANILPFLKSHNIANACHYTAASQVLASLSSYQFTRRAWRREVFELFIDSTFFQATAPALHSWCAVVDNLMTQEKNTFKEALTRLTVSQGAGLNIFTSKEAEYEQRAAHLKKINFIVFSSECEQYSRFISDILERLTDSLRAMTDVNVPILTQIFLCTRVLIARISADSLASLWFIVIPELVNVFRIFSERCNGGSKKYSALSFEHLQKLPQSQLTLLLSACKLLSTILLLPESIIPQLLFHRWVFINHRADGRSKGEEVEGSELNSAFQPLMSKISSGLTSIYQGENQTYSTQLLSMTSACYFILSLKNVTTFEPLELFFRSLGEKRTVSETSSEVFDEGTLSQVLEVSLFNEFPESMAASK